MWLKFFFALLIVIECVLTIYIPSFIEKNLIKIRKNRLVNLENFENIASGAILALAIIHLLPEAVLISQKQKLNPYNIFIIIILAVTFLNVTDILYESRFKFDEDITGDSTGDGIAAKNNDSQIFDKREIGNIIAGNTGEDSNISKMKTKETYDIENNNSPPEKNVKKQHEKHNIFFEIAKSNSFFIIISLVIHSLVEGMLLGGLKDASSVAIVAISYLAHKWAECLIIYKNVMLKVNNTYLSLIYAWSFILALPVGLIITMFYFPSSETVEIIFTSVACGFFIYLSFDMTKDVKITDDNKNYVAGSYFFGVTGMSTLMLTLAYFENI